MYDFGKQSTARQLAEVIHQDALRQCLDLYPGRTEVISELLWKRLETV